MNIKEAAIEISALKARNKFLETKVENLEWEYNHKI